MFCSLAEGDGEVVPFCLVYDNSLTSPHRIVLRKMALMVQ
jgi:hypothetical protein